MATAELAETEADAVIRLGVLQTIPASLVAGWLHDFLADHGDVRFDLYDGTEQELLNRLDERGIDYALSIRRVADDTAMPLFEEGYRLVLPRRHPLAGQAVIEGEALANENMIVRTRCEVLSETSRHFTDRNVRPPLVYRTPQDERALAMVGAGVGITVMPESYSADDIAGVPMAGFGLRRMVALFRPRYDLPERTRRSGEAFSTFLCKRFSV